MRHRDQETASAALEDWKGLRKKVEEEGGDQYEKPVLVKFFDKNTYEVMERDIVEDEFYVLRKYKIIRELDAEGKDLEQAIKEAGKTKPRGQRSRGGRGGSRRSGSKKSGSKQSGEKKEDGKSGSKPRNRRGGRRRGKRSGGRGRGGKGGGSSGGGGNKGGESKS